MNYIILNNELYHHGVLGQKWGVRRYQNKDGSLTAAGKKHYDIDDVQNKMVKKLSKNTTNNAIRSKKRSSKIIQEAIRKSGVIDGKTKFELDHLKSKFETNLNIFNTAVRESKRSKNVTSDMIAKAYDDMMESNKQYAAKCKEIGTKIAGPHKDKKFNVVVKTSIKQENLANIIGSEIYNMPYYDSTFSKSNNKRR